MNSLSWMIYAAEALGNLSMSAGIMALVSALGIGAVMFVGLIAASVDNPSGVVYIHKAMRKWWVPATLLLISAVLPSSNTIYMIAASEAGETIVKSQEAKEVFDDLKTVIKSKLKEQLPKP
jgi:hypothetical protein